MGIPLDTPRSDGAVAALIEGYRPQAGRYDEMMDGDGRVRRHWWPLIDSFGRTGRDTVSRRFAAADQHLISSGVFYRVYEETSAVERPYALSHVPLIVSAQDWAEIAAGLRQRADLLEAIVADVYGPQSLHAAGHLPPAVVAGSPEYLRPLHGVRPRGGRHLTLYAADIGRDGAGRWWVLGDRTQAPSGWGYALENRIALSRALGEVYAEYRVAPLAGYFEAVRQTLLAARQPNDAGVCILSPGPLNEAYFEHVYLARFLGLKLVEGQDLTVQDGRVFLRTVAGLREIAVIVRRIDADFADPIELDTRSRLGIPGLVGALRAGRVTLANALGTGLAEAAAFMGFLPALAPQLLGAPLAMPNVATWWCGQPAERDYVLANLDRLVVAPAFTPAGSRASAMAARHGGSLNEADRAAVRAGIAYRGGDVVGQEPVHLSTMPVWVDGRLVPRPFVLRVYLAATAHGWQVMPGGLALVGDRPDQTVLTMQQGARAADVWIPGLDATLPTSDGPATPDAVEIRRASAALPSRAADNLFWLARYLERAETTLRILGAAVDRLGESRAGRSYEPVSLVDLLVGWGAARPGDPTTAAITTALFDVSMPGSVATLTRRARTAAAVIRNRFPLEAWRTLDETHHLLAGGPGGRPGAGFGTETAPGEVVAVALRNLAAITGMELDNMNRLSGWRFLKLGTRIERGILISRLARHLAAPGAAPTCLDALLEIADCQITYRIRYSHGAMRAPVLDIVLLDEGNPRSLSFTVASIAEHLAALAGVGVASGGSPAPEAFETLHGRVSGLDPRRIGPPELIAVENLLMQLSNHVTARYFDLHGAIAPGSAANDGGP